MSERFEIVRRGYAHKYKEIAPYITHLESSNAALRAQVEKLKLDLSGKTFSCSQCNVYAKRIERLKGALKMIVRIGTKDQSKEQPGCCMAYSAECEIAKQALSEDAGE